MAIVLLVTPETEEFEREWTLVDVNVPRAVDAESMDTVIGSIEWAREEINCMGLTEAIWGDEKEAPSDVLAGGKFIVFGHMESYRSGSPLDGYEEDSCFEIESYRRLA